MKTKKKEKAIHIYYPIEGLELKNGIFSVLNWLLMASHFIYLPKPNGYKIRFIISW